MSTAFSTASGTSGITHFGLSTSASSMAVPRMSTLSTNLCLSTAFSTASGTSGITHFSTATMIPKKMEKMEKNHSLTSAPSSDISCDSNCVLDVISSALVATDIMENRLSTEFQVPSPSEPLGSGLCDDITRLVASTLSSKMLLMIASSGINGKHITNKVT